MGYLTLAKGPCDLYCMPGAKAKSGPESKPGRIGASYDPKKSDPKFGTPMDKAGNVALALKSGNKAATKATFKGHNGGSTAGTKGHMSDSFERELEGIMERTFFPGTKFHKIGNVPGGRTWPQYGSGDGNGSKGPTKVVYNKSDNPGTKKEDVGSNMSPIGTRRSPGETEGGQPPAQFVQGGEGRRRSHESFDRTLEQGLSEILSEYAPMPPEPPEIKPLLNSPKSRKDAIKQVLITIDNLLGGSDFPLDQNLGDWRVNISLNDMPFKDPEKSYKDLSSIFGFGVGAESLIIDIADKLLQSENDT